MPVFQRTKDEFLTDILKNLSSKTPLNQTAPGSKTRVLTEDVAQELQNLSQTEATNHDNSFLPTAEGQWAEAFASMVGQTKNPAKAAEVVSTDRSIKFYVNGGGTFGSINNNQSIVIDAGTTLTAPSDVALEASSVYLGINTGDTRTDRSISFITTEAVVCDSTATEAFVSAKALTNGVAGNLAAPNMLTTHSFNSYSDYSNQTLKITNVKPIINGTDEESLTSLKYKSSKAITAGERANQTAVEVAVRNVPGVADFKIINFEDGIGRFNVYIKSITPTVPDTVLDQVQTKLDLIQACGCSGIARRPYEIGIEINSNLVYVGNYKDEEKAIIRQNFAHFSALYINSLDIGQPFLLSDLATQLVRLDGRVRAVGSNTNTLFDDVYVYYPARLESSGKRRERLISGTVEAGSNSRIITESTVTIPIRFV